MPPSPTSHAMATWRGTIGRVWQDLTGGRASIMAGGVAFYGFLALFPAGSTATASRREPAEIASPTRPPNSDTRRPSTTAPAACPSSSLTTFAEPL